MVFFCCGGDPHEKKHAEIEKAVCVCVFGVEGVGIFAKMDRVARWVNVLYSYRYGYCTNIVG